MGFEPSERSRRKVAGRVAGLLEPGTQIRAVGFGRANGRWSTTSTVILAGFAVIFGVALAFGTLLVPGAILVAIFWQATWPPRVVVVADKGVAVLDRSLFNGRPTKVLARLPHLALTVPAPSQGEHQSDRRQLGPDLVRFKGTELQRLLAAVPQPVATGR
jgi:hypothetical protein